jgi:hypothetical protein
MVRTPDYKWFVRSERESLFDMRSDPYELDDLINSPRHQPVVREMKERLRRFLMETQVNLSASYKSLFVRINERADREGVNTQLPTSDWLLEQFRRLHFGPRSSDTTRD